MFKILAYIIFFSTTVMAQQIEFIGPCSSRPLFSQSFASKFDTVGDLTVHVLNKNGIPYQGNEEGINSAFGTPIGMDAIEVLSDTEMRSYGWCYFVDGKMSDIYAHQFPLKPSVKKVQWIFSFALLKKDKWVSMCEKAYLVKPSFLCKK